MKRYFITGTNTDCGKTYVTRTLVDFYEHSVAIKPVASACRRIGTQLISPDAEVLQKNSTLSLDQINPWRYEQAVSPHIAARQEGRPIVLEELVDYCLNLQLQGIDRLFIEGAGGLYVPLNEEATWVDFLKRTEIPVILVVGMTLGCINHALLTQTALDAHSIECIGWIANCLDPQMLALEENIATLEQQLKFPLLARVSFSGGLGARLSH